MDRLVKKIANKLISADLAAGHGTGRPLVGGLDDELVWNRNGPETEVLEKVFAGLNINSLVFLRPKAPYDRIIDSLARRADGCIEPEDCETRTFLHDLPVVQDFDADTIIKALKRRKSVIVTSPEKGQGPAVIAHGMVSPEQGFVVVSSVCFACFVKFFADYLTALQTGGAQALDHDTFDAVKDCLSPLDRSVPRLMAAPFAGEAAVYKAIAQAGLQTVTHGLVDSYFGNISYCWNGTLYISQTGSSLDELAGCVDPVPLDGATSAGITASSELSAHLETLARTGCRAILHGHPKFAVVLSMDCPPQERLACHFADRCHIKCPKPRFVGDVPIVPGEVGTGPTGLCRTLPAALEKSTAAIVYGHGLFTTGRDDFNEAFGTLMAVENHCRDIYFEKIKELRFSGYPQGNDK
jgi:ribulose-5-phosphate 4-epimerase/fuculose-1-phosphate aldolase